jgi:phosphoribosylaminoimidazolecarboxamide formyltransferase/IMP cyclohydrolase
MNIKKAIISTYNKEGLEEFGRFLYENHVEIISTGGTAEYLESKGIEVTKIQDYTDTPEILNGRVKSIHPKLFGGVLAKVGNKDHDSDLKNLDISRIDLVVVNLYPFDKIAEKTTKEEQLLEYIDIGGLALLRAAAKNYRDVVPIVDPADYKSIIDSIEDCGDVPLHNRRKLALKSFYSTSRYDSTIHKIFSELFASEKYDHEFFEIVGMLRYGSNPLQEATLLKIAEKESMFDYLENLTKHKSPTLRILKDIKLLFNVVSKTEKDFLGFAKKGVFVFGYNDPSEKDFENFLNQASKMRGGVIFTNNVELIKKLKEFKIDCILTTQDLDREKLLSYKSMVFKMDKKVIEKGYEYLIDEDLVIKQESKDLNIDVEYNEKIAFEIAKQHKSDTVVYVNNNRIFSGVQNALNRKIALNILEIISDEYNCKLKGGTLIFDSPINSEYILSKIEEWEIKNVIVPPALPKDEQYLEILKEKGINIFVTPNRYHKY